MHIHDLWRGLGRPVLQTCVLLRGAFCFDAGCAETWVGVAYLRKKDKQTKKLLIRRYAGSNQFNMIIKSYDQLYVCLK